MTTYRSEIIREVETDLHTSRYARLVKCEGKTFTQVQAARAKHRRLALRLAGWVALAMIVLAFAVHGL